MEHFCFFCVTYEGDYEEFCAMVESFKKHNIDKIKLIVALQGIEETQQDFKKSIPNLTTQFEAKNLDSVLNEKSYTNSAYIKNQNLDSANFANTAESIANKVESKSYAFVKKDSTNTTQSCSDNISNLDSKNYVESCQMVGGGRSDIINNKIDSKENEYSAKYVESSTQETNTQNLVIESIDFLNQRSKKTSPSAQNLKLSNLNSNKAESSNILEKFKAFECECVEIISDTSFSKPYLIKERNKKLDFSIGYINQQIAKLAFWESRMVEHYLCIDSDSIFIRDFRKDDFFYDKFTPYICLVQDKDLLSKPYYIGFGKERQRQIKKIFSLILGNDKRFRTCHNSQIISSVVMRHFKEHFMNKNNFSYIDLLEIAPFEFSWYSAYFQKCEVIEEKQIEPFFKIYHTKAEFVLDKLAGQSMQNLKSQYIGIILNSNWAKGGIKGAKNSFKKRGILGRILFYILKKIY